LSGVVLPVPAWAIHRPSPRQVGSIQAVARPSQEDGDNYIDIILVGDQAAARNITFVEYPR
jgi:hypothetical protein